MKNTFGSFIRKKRISMGLTLRSFCKSTGYDIGYISRLENGILLPPVEESKLRKLAKFLKVNFKSEEWDTFKTLADVSRRQIPKELDEKVLNYLPAFFRKASKKKVNKKDVENLIKLIKGNSS